MSPRGDLHGITQSRHWPHHDVVWVYDFAVVTLQGPTQNATISNDGAAVGYPVADLNCVRHATDLHRWERPPTPHLALPNEAQVSVTRGAPGRFTFGNDGLGSVFHRPRTSRRKHGQHSVEQSGEHDETSSARQCSKVRSRRHHHPNDSPEYSCRSLSNIVPRTFRRALGGLSSLRWVFAISSPSPGDWQALCPRG